MKIYLESSTIASNLLDAAKTLVLAFFPRYEVQVRLEGELQCPEDASEGAILELEVVSDKDVANALYSSLQGTWRIKGRNGEWPEGVKSHDSISLTAAEVQTILVQPEIGRENSGKLLVKHGICKLLSSVSGRSLPWGILTGIRPSKLLHRLEDLGVAESLQGDALNCRYRIRADKICLLQEIVALQRPYLQDMQSHPKRVAVYVGIPFCPSRCTYCTFPGYILDQQRHDLADYLLALHKEIKQTGEMMERLGLEVDTLYIGGGTPTTLAAEELEDLIQNLKRSFPRRKNLEFTVEAGRPDTLTPAKLETLRNLGITRLSINPQSMQDKTLQRIGRAHRVADICEMFKVARSLSDWMINMDLILGLPGEDVSAVHSTLEQIGELCPDNLTVHALALKRGSLEWEKGYANVEAKVIEEMAAMTREVVRTWGLSPYYLYRQKQIAGNLENIGYAKPGAECRYNIGIMEERQSVIGLGAGASSKVVNSKDYTLVNLRNPTNWRTYVERWVEGQQKRETYFRTALVDKR